MITLETVGAFIAGVIIPLVIAMFGREALGKWLMGKQQREDTALSALISLAQESIAGWRESNVAVVNLSSSMREHDDKMVSRASQAAAERLMMKTLSEDTQDRLQRMNERLNALVQLLGEPSNQEIGG